MISGNVWPVHPHPLPDELLSSWLIRFAKENLQKLHSFTKLTVPDHQVWNRDVDKSAPLKLLLPLAFQSGQHVSSLYHTTLWPYAGKLYAKHSPNSNNRWILHAGVYHRSRKRYGLQYCPLCLAQDPPYFRRLWRLAFVTVCPEHGTLLLDRCPNCKAPVAPHKVDMGVHTNKTEPSDVPINVCHRCGKDLSGNDPSRLKVADPDIRTFQAKLLNALETGYTTLPSHGKAHESVHSSLAYFDGLRPLLTALTGTRHTGPFGAHVAERVGIPDMAFDLADTPNDFEYQPFINRHQLLRMAAWLFGDWSERFIQAYAQTEMAPSYLLGDMGEVPLWLETAVDEAHEARLRFEKEHKPPNAYGDLTGQDKACLQDLLEHGADRIEVVCTRVVDSEYLLNQRYLTTLDSPLGTLVSIGSRGRRALGVCQCPPLTPNTAAGQVMRRRVREKLEAQGWTYLKKEGRFLISLRSPEGKKRYLLCGYGKYDSRTVRRNFSKLEEWLVEEDAVLMVVSREPEKLMGIEAVKEGWVEVTDANIAGNFYQE